LNRGRHLYSAGRPSRWALAHILVQHVSVHVMFKWQWQISSLILCSSSFQELGPVCDIIKGRCCRGLWVLKLPDISMEINCWWTFSEMWTDIHWYLLSRTCACRTVFESCSAELFCCARRNFKTQWVEWTWCLTTWCTRCLDPSFQSTTSTAVCWKSSTSGLLSG